MKIERNEKKVSVFNYWTRGNKQRFTVAYFKGESEIACQPATVTTSPKVVAKKVNEFLGMEMVKAYSFGIGFINPQV